MYGAIGYPLRLSRTVITGKRKDDIKRLLYILTYFIRCSQMFENISQSEKLKLDHIQYSGCSEKINIPASADFQAQDCGADVFGKTTESWKSGQSFQTQTSCCYCLLRLLHFRFLGRFLFRRSSLWRRLWLGRWLG